MQIAALAAELQVFDQDGQQHQALEPHNFLDESALLLLPL